MLEELPDRMRISGRPLPTQRPFSFRWDGHAEAEDPQGHREARARDGHRKARARAHEQPAQVRGEVLLAQASNTQEVSGKIDSYLQDKERTQTVKLNETVPVELRYETIVLEDGKLRIYKDVYAQETNTEENLRSVLEAHGTSLEDLSEQQRTQILNALKDAKKETVIDISSVAKKGYPAPVNLDTGNTDKRRSKPRIRS